MRQLDSENADRNLTSLVTVLTHTPDASVPTLCQGLIFLGDGTKNLDGTGGEFEVTVTVGGQTLQPNPQVIEFDTAVRATIFTTAFPVPANAQVIMRVLSPNGADTDVDVTAYLYEVSSLQPATLGRQAGVESDGHVHGDLKEWLGVAPLALSSQQVQAVVPNTQKVDVETIKTQTVTLSGGVTIPAATLASTTNITAGTVTTATNVTTVNGLANNVITTASINDGALTAAKIADNAITAAKIASDAIANAKIADGAITASKIADNSLTAAKFASGAFDAVWTVGARTLTSISGLGIALATKLTKYVQLLARKDSAIATDNATELTEINADGGSGAGAYANTTDSQEALRDRGDAAWVTATGFSTHTAADVWAVGVRVLTAGTNIVLAKGTGVTGFTDLSAAQVNEQVDAAIETYFLHHLFHTTYDPASKPGAADALLNELVENDSGVARYTANALEQAPTGGSAPTAVEIADEVAGRFDGLGNFTRTLPARPLPWIASTGLGVSFSPDCRVLLLGFGSIIQAWEWAGRYVSAYTAMDDYPSVGNPRDIAWHPSGRAFAAGFTTTPTIAAWPWSNDNGFGDIFSAPATPPTGSGGGVDFSPSGESIAVACSDATRVHAWAFDPDTGFGTKFSNPGTLPTGSGNMVRFSKSGDTIAVAHATTPFITVYPWDDSTGFDSKYSDPSDLGAGAGNGVAWNPAGTALALACSTSPFLVVYHFTEGSGFGADYDAAASPPGSACQDVQWSPDGRYLAVVCNSSPFLHVWEWSDADGFLDAMTIDTLPPATPRELHWSADGNYLIVSHSDSDSGAFIVYAIGKGRVKIQQGAGSGELDAVFGAVPPAGSVTAEVAAADIRSAIGLASANLDTQLGTIATAAAAILDDTGTSGVVVAAASKSGYALSATGLNLIVPADPGTTEPTFAGNATIVQWIAFFGAVSVNKAISDSDSVTIRNTGDSGNLIVFATSDDGTSFTVGMGS